MHSDRKENEIQQRIYLNRLQYYSSYSNIVDDATPDDSIEKCERLIDVYHGPIQLSILHHEKNRGLSAARNTGTKAATGDYVLSIEMVMGKYIHCTEGSPIPPNLQPRKKGKETDLLSLEAVRKYWFGRKGINVYSAFLCHS